MLFGITRDGQGVSQVSLPGTFLVLAAVEEIQTEDIVQLLGMHAIQIPLEVHHGTQLPGPPVRKELGELAVTFQGVVIQVEPILDPGCQFLQVGQGQFLQLLGGQIQEC